MLLILQSISIYAYKINLENTPSLTDCKSDKSEKLFYCKDKSGNEYLIKDTGWEYTAVKKSIDGRIEKKTVNEIYSDDGEGLFIAPISRETFFEDEAVAPFVGDFADYADELSYIYKDLFFSFKKTDLSPNDKELSKLVFDIKSSIEKKKNHYDKVFASDKLGVKLVNGDSLNCSRNKDLPNCPLLTCGKDSNGNDVVLLKDKDSDSSYIETFSFKNGEIAKEHSGIKGLYASNGEKLLSKSATIESENPFKKKMLVPAKYKNSPELLEKLTDHSYGKFLLGSVSSCGEKMVPYFNNLIRDAFNDMANAEMVQLIDFANGSLESYYVNNETLPDYACVHEGVYYSPEGFKKSSDIKRMSKRTITAKKAQELFDSASEREDIAWDYTFDGCYARAHLMARMFEEEGIHVDKAWLRGSLQIPGESPQMKWGYHVAPLVYVENEQGGVDEMIIDPSVSDRPLSASEWAKIMEVDFSKSDQVVYPTPTNTSFFNKTSFAVTSSEPYWPMLDMALTEENKMSMAENTMIQYTSGLDPWGEEYEQW